MFLCATERAEPMTGLQVEWLDGPSVFPQTEFKKGFYFQKGYLEALVTGAANRGRFLFPQVKNGSTLVAAGCFQELVLYRDELDELGRLFASDSRLSLKVEGLVKSVMNLGRGKKGVRILIAGNCQVTGPYGVCFAEGLTEEEKAECWALLLKETEAQMGPFSITLVKDFSPEQEEVIERLQKDNYRRVPTLPVMRFHLDAQWKSFDDYLQAMASKYRIRAKAARKKGVKLVRENWDVDQIQQHLDRIDELYRNVFEKARFRLFRVEPAYFLELKRKMGDRFLFKAYLLDGELVGFSTFLIDAAQSDAHLIGIDYSANKLHSLYQNMLYDYVASGIEAGTAIIDFGRTAMEIKSTIGAVPEDSPVIVKMRNPLLNGLASMLMENTTPAPWIQRHPFREEEPAKHN